MSSWTLLETTDSVIEVLWDVVLAFFVVRTAFVYFLVSFTSSIVLSYLTSMIPLPFSYFNLLPQSLVLITVYLVPLVAGTKLMIAYYEIPRIVGFRLAIGGVALLFMLMADVLVALVLYEEGLGPWIFKTVWETRLASVMLPIVFAMMPTLLLVAEMWPGVESQSASSGQETKSIKEAA
jgi:hypothetical protein